MPYQVKQLIEGHPSPVCVREDTPVSEALTLMLEHDFSQLPVIVTEDGLTEPVGMVTYRGILRGIRYFQASLEELTVKDVLENAPIFTPDDDLFDILDAVKTDSAVLIVDSDSPGLIGIVTSYDTTEYFRNRTEDLMRVEDVELMIKDFIRAAYPSEDEEINTPEFNKVLKAVTKHYDRPKKFSELTLGDYIHLLVHTTTWNKVGHYFSTDREHTRKLLEDVRRTRNDLAHFRSDITAAQRDALNFCAEWLTRCYNDYQREKEKNDFQQYMSLFQKGDGKQLVMAIAESPAQYHVDREASENGIPEHMEIAATSGSRYAALADWLQGQPGNVDRVTLTFDDIESIIGAPLPPSARAHRAWWANDSVGHVQSQQWLEAGWRTTYLNLTEQRVTFARIREREKAYIAFFSKLLEDLRQQPDFPFKPVSPDGASWMVVQNLPRSGSRGQFVFSFTRDRRMRVELYLDLGDQAATKAAFDRLAARKDEFERELGEPLTWERLDNRRASRIYLAHEGHILDDEEKLAALRTWAAPRMARFYRVLAEPADAAI